jgi:uncharacterized protein
MRPLLKVIGWFFSVLAIIGIFVPLLPTTPLALVALACFSRSSPQLRAWLWNHKTLGPYLHDWKNHGVIQKSAKTKAIILIGISAGVTLWMRSLPYWGMILVITTLFGVSIFILTRPSKPSKQSG